MLGVERQPCKRSWRGSPEKLRRRQVDVDGNVWAGAGDGVYVYAPDGELLGAVTIGEVSNLAFAGDTLIMLQACIPCMCLCCAPQQNLLSVSGYLVPALEVAVQL